MSIWSLILVLGIAGVLMKVIGPALAGGKNLPERLEDVIDLFPLALLASLVTTGVATHGQAIVIDDRLVGAAFGLVVLLLRAPMVVAGAVAACVCALLRLQ